MSSKDQRVAGFDSFLFGEQGREAVPAQDPAMSDQDLRGNAAVQEEMLSTTSGGDDDSFDPFTEDPEEVGSYTRRGEREAEGYEAGDSGAEGEATATLYNDGAGVSGSGVAAADSDNGEGMTAAGSLSLGGGLTARATHETLDDGRVCVAVLVTAEASIGGETSFAQDDQGGTKTAFGGGIGASGSASAEWESVDILSAEEARGVLGAWAGGDAARAAAALPSLASIVNAAAQGDGSGVSSEGMQPGEQRRAKTAIEGELCLSGAWSKFAVEGAAGSSGEQEGIIEARADGTLRVTRSFAGTTTLSAAGNIDLGDLQLSAGRAQEVQAGYTAVFLFDASESSKADAVLSLQTREQLERTATDSPAVIRHEIHDAVKTSNQQGIGGMGLDAEWSGSSERDDSIALGIDGMEGTTVSGASTDGFTISREGDTVLGMEDETSMSMEVGDGGRFSAARTETSLGAGLPSLDAVKKLSWPTAFKSAFVYARKRLFAVKLTDSDLSEVLTDRVMDVASWDACARYPRVRLKWKLTGDAMRAAVPPEAWVAADATAALLTCRMQHLADFVAGEDRAAHVIDNLLTRFGEGQVDDAGQDAERPALGTADYWPSGTEDLEESVTALRERLATAPDEFATFQAADDQEAGRDLMRALRTDVGLVVRRVGRADTEDARWKTMLIQELEQGWSDASWQFASLEAHGTCSTEEGDSGVGGATEALNQGRQEEAFSLLSSMEALHNTEQGVLTTYSGTSGQRAATAFLTELKGAYDAWTVMLERLRGIKGADYLPATVPDFDEAAELYCKVQPGSEFINRTGFYETFGRVHSTWSAP